VSQDAAGPTDGPAASSWQLHQHAIHISDWYWANVEAGSAEVSFTLAHDSLFRLHISKMTQVVRAGETAEDAAHQHMNSHLGAHDSRLSVIPSLYSATAFLQSGSTILQRNEVSILRRLAPGQYKVLFEFDERLTPNFLLESCPKFLMELEIETEESIRTRMGLTAAAAATPHSNPHLPAPICPEQSRLPHIPFEGEALEITSHGFKFGQTPHTDHAHLHGAGDEVTEHTTDASAGHSFTTYEHWFTLNAKDDAGDGSSPHGRPIYSLPFVLPDLVGFQALVSARLDFQFGIGALRLGISSGYHPSFTFAENIFADAFLDGNELHAPLAPGQYFLNVFEPLPQLHELSGPCVFWNLGFEVEFLPLPSAHPGLHSAAQQAQLREVEQESMNHEELCPYDLLPSSLNTVGLAGLHGNNLHLHGAFRVDFQSNLAHKHDIYFATHFIHSSPFARTDKVDHTLLEPSLFRFYLPTHETNLKFHVDLIRLTPTVRPDMDKTYDEEHIKGIDTSIWDHMVEELQPGEYILRFSLSKLSFRPNEELCIGFTMELSVLPLSRARVAADCLTHEPVIPDCPAIPYSFHSGFGAAPFATEFDRATWEGGSATLQTFPLEIRYRDTVLDMEVFSDFARAPLSIVLHTEIHGDQQDPLLDTSLTHPKLQAHAETNGGQFKIEDKEKFTGHAIHGRQLKKNTQSLRTVLKPGHYSIHIRLLAPASFYSLQTGKEHSTNMLEAHHICVPYSFQLSLESAITLSLQQQACQHGQMFILPSLLNTLEFQPTEYDLTDIRLHFAHKFLLPHAHEKQEGAQPFHDDTGESADQSFFWLENLSLVHLVLDQLDQGLRVLLVHHPKCAENPLAGTPPMHHMNGDPHRDTHPISGEVEHHEASLLQIDEVLSASSRGRIRARARAGPSTIHPHHAEEGDNVVHDAGFSPDHPHQPKDLSHPGHPAPRQPKPHGETDRHGHPKNEEEEAQHAEHYQSEHESPFQTHDCENITLFESTESLITLHRYLLPGLYSIVIEETEMSRQDAVTHAPYRSCPYYHLQFSIASIWDLEKVSSNVVCNAKSLDGSSGGINSHSTTPPSPTAGMDSWPPDTPRKITAPYLFDSVLANRSLHFQQKLDQLRAETITFTVDEVFHFFAEIKYDFYLSYMTLDLMSLDSKSVVNYAGRATENGHVLVHSFLPKGDYILTIGEGKKRMDETPREVLQNASPNSAYTLHHVSPQDHPGFACVEFAFKVEILPLSSFATGLSAHASANSVAGDHHSFKSRMVSDGVHADSASFLASSVAAQQLLHFAATHLPNYPFLPRTLCSTNFMRDVVSSDLTVDLFGIYSLNAVHMDEEFSESVLKNNAHLPNKITFTLSTTSIFRLFAVPFANRLNPEAARAFVLATSLTHELDSAEQAAHTIAEAATGIRASQPMEMQTSEPPAPGTHDHFSWMFGILYPGTYTLVIQPIVLPSHRAIYSSGVFGRMNWFESVIQMAISPVKEDQESLSPHSCTQPSAVPACADSVQSASSPDSAAMPEENLEFHQNEEHESYHHVAPAVPVCPLHRGDRIVLATLHLDRRSEITTEVSSDFLSNDVLLALHRFDHGKIGWGVDRWSAHRTQRGQDLSLIVPPGAYGVTVHSLGSLAKLPFIFGCGNIFHFAIHVEPVVEGHANLGHGLVQAKPSIHLPSQKSSHPAVQHTTMDPNSAQHACPPFSMFPASLFDSRGQESDLYLKHSRHSARLHGERFEVNEPGAAQRFHYLQIDIDVESVLRIDIRTPSKEYARNFGLYSHHSTPEQRIIDPVEQIIVNPRLTTLVYVLKPEPSIIPSFIHPTPGHANDPLFHPRTNFLLSVGGTASSDEWTSNACPFFALDLVLTPLHQLKEHVVPAPKVEGTPVNHGHQAHSCALLHNNAPELTPTFTVPLYKPLWWSGLQHSLEIQFDVTHRDGVTAMILLQHSIISSLFSVELVSLDQDASIPFHARSFDAIAESLVSSEKVQVDTYHPVDLFFTRDYAVTIRALLAVGSYKVIMKEKMSGALAAALGVHEDEICMPLAVIMSLQPYSPPVDAPTTHGIHAWPVHITPLPANEILTLAGEEDHVSEEFAADAANAAVGGAHATTDAIDPIDEAHVIPETFDQDHAAPEPGLVHPTHIVHGPESDAHLAVEPIEEAISLVHPLHEPDDDPPPYDVNGVEHDSDDLVLGGKKSPQSPDYNHPVNDLHTFPDSYQTKSLRDHLAEHHPDDPLIAHIDEHGHPEHPALIDALKEKGSRFFETGGRLIRTRDYSTLDLTVFTLAILVTIALCCVAISLHCRCGAALIACCGRLAPYLCPCLTRFFIVRKLKSGDEIQLKKTLYYDSGNMDDDNL
jgi:hypothetical protein